MIVVGVLVKEGIMHLRGLPLRLNNFFLIFLGISYLTMPIFTNNQLQSDLRVKSNISTFVDITLDVLLFYTQDLISTLVNENKGFVSLVRYLILNSCICLLRFKAWIERKISLAFCIQICSFDEKSHISSFAYTSYSAAYIVSLYSILDLQSYDKQM